MSSKGSFLMERIFTEDPAMQKPKEEGPGRIFNLLDRYSETVIRLDGQGMLVD